MVTPKNRLADGEAPLPCHQHGIRKDPRGPARSDQPGDHRSVSSVQLYYL